MSKITYKEYRGDRFLGLSAQRDGKRLGYAITISWIANNCGAAFARNFNPASVYVRVTKDGGVGPDGSLLPDVVLFNAEAGRALYQRDAHKLARAFIREKGLKALIERSVEA